jgi:hypothetical protein
MDPRADGGQTSSFDAVLLDSTLPLELGADVDVGTVDAFYIGDLDDVCFWGRPLTDTEIAQLAAM